MEANVTSPISIDAEQARQESAELTVLGAGAWGTALAKLVEKNDHTVCLWSRRSAMSMAAAVQDSHVILSAVSMKGVPLVAAQLKELNIPPETIIVTATKGLDPETTRTPSQIFHDTFPDNPVVVLSGPNLSKEIERGLPAATVAASLHPEAAEAVQYLFSSDIFRVYRSPDPLGAELGGTLKNVVAIAVGVCEGLDLGSNARSALMTRALPEMIRIGTRLGGHAETFVGLSGLGDMLATCTSPLSRNYRVGYGLAQGKSLDQILEEIGSTAEGVNTTNVLIQIANRESIPAPISRQVYRLLNGQISAQQAVEALMERDLKAEACLLT